MTKTEFNYVPAKWGGGMRAARTHARSDMVQLSSELVPGPFQEHVTGLVIAA